MISYLQSLQAGLHEAFAEDDQVYLIGEDLVDPYGGAFKVSKGLSTLYPRRVLSTPISEAGFTGLAAGMALRGFKPVVEIMFGDFLTLCADQIVNHITKFRAMYNEQVQVPIVIRTPMGGGRGYGATHSQSLEKMFLGIPNLQVVAPSHVHHAGALLKHAILKNTNPVLFIENKLLYPLPLLGGASMQVTHLEDGDTYPTALVKNFSGSKADISLISYGGMSREIVPLMERLAHEEIKVVAAFPSRISQVPINVLTEVAQMSEHVMIVEEGTAGFNWGSEVATQLYEQLMQRLRNPIRRLSSRDGIIPTARNLEDEVLVTAEKIEQAILEMLA